MEWRDITEIKLSKSDTAVNEAIKRLLKTIPSVSDTWEEHMVDWGGEEAGGYNDIAVIARHIHTMYPARPTKNN